LFWLFYSCLGFMLKCFLGLACALRVFLVLSLFAAISPLFLLFFPFRLFPPSGPPLRAVPFSRSSRRCFSRLFPLLYCFFLRLLLFPFFAGFHVFSLSPPTSGLKPCPCPQSRSPHWVRLWIGPGPLRSGTFLFFGLLPRTWRKPERPPKNPPPLTFFFLGPFWSQVVFFYPWLGHGRGIFFYIGPPSHPPKLSIFDLPPSFFHPRPHALIAGPNTF